MPLSLWWLILVLVAMYQVVLRCESRKVGLVMEGCVEKAEGGEKTLPQ